MADVFAYLEGFGASGGEGGTLKVNAPPLVAVTITNKAGKTKIKTANADGMAIFKGLASGKWNVTIVNSDGKPTTITADVQTEYTITIAFFSATINVTYPAGSTCTCTDGVTTLTAPDTSGTWACIVPNVGTWTVSCTDGTKSKSADAAITTDGQSVSVTLKYILYIFKKGEGAVVPMKTTDSRLSITNDAIIAEWTNDYDSAITVDKVDLSIYTVLKFDIDGDAGTFNKICGVTTNQDPGYNGMSTDFIASTSISNEKIQKIYEVDITKVNSGYVAITGAFVYRCYNIWAE